MDYILVGKVVNTHALKGEVRLLSDFPYKDKAFKEGMNLYIDNEKVTISTYRHHKIFDMLTFKEYNNITEVLKFKGKEVYAIKSEIDLEGKLLDSDYISLMGIYKNKTIGYVEEVINNNGYKLLKINNKHIPLNENFIEKIDLENRKIYFKNLEGLI